jgi:predicted DNA-binding protein YlxM (UPF0122 family)
MKYSKLLKKYNVNEQKLIEEYLKDTEFEEMKRKFKCSRDVIDRVIKENNIPLRKKYWSKSSQNTFVGIHDRFVLERLSKGISQSKIARELGVSRQRVHQILKRSKKINQKGEK